MIINLDIKKYHMDPRDSHRMDHMVSFSTIMNNNPYMLRN